MAISATAAPMFVVMIGLPLALQSDRIVLSPRFDPASLSAYSYVAQLYTPLWSVISVAGLALWPHFAANKLTPAALRKSWSTGLAILSVAGLRRACISASESRCSPMDERGHRQARVVALVGLRCSASRAVGASHDWHHVDLTGTARFQAACVVALVATTCRCLGYSRAAWTGGAGAGFGDYRRRVPAASRSRLGASDYIYPGTTLQCVRRRPMADPVTSAAIVALTVAALLILLSALRKARAREEWSGSATLGAVIVLLTISFVELFVTYLGLWDKERNAYRASRGRSRPWRTGSCACWP